MKRLSNFLNKQKVRAISLSTAFIGFIISLILQNLAIIIIFGSLVFLTYFIIVLNDHIVENNKYKPGVYKPINYKQVIRDQKIDKILNGYNQGK